MAAGAAAAVGGLLVHAGISPGHISEREPSVDRIVNHILYFGPCLAVGWLALWFAGGKRPVATVLIFCTLLWLCGFAAVK